jgi:hypothetical protein
MRRARRLTVSQEAIDARMRVLSTAGQALRMDEAWAAFRA